MTKKISCTGIKPTGIIHLGNYLGSIKPSIELAKEYDARYFIADYHALNSIRVKIKVCFKDGNIIIRFRKPFYKNQIYIIAVERNKYFWPIRIY